MRDRDAEFLTMSGGFWSALADVHIYRAHILAARHPGRRQGILIQRDSECSPAQVPAITAAKTAVVSKRSGASKRIQSWPELVIPRLLL
jgi:hypothetical protein